MASIPAHTRTQGIRQQISSRRRQQHQAGLRPILTSINGNVAWIISLPRSDLHMPAHGREKAYYHILVDPWFGEEAVAGHRFVLGMTLVNPPALKDPAAVVRAIREIEAAASDQDLNPDGSSSPSGDGDHNHDEGEGEEEGVQGEGVVDAIIATGGVEHAVYSSFTRFSPTIPVFAATASYKRICAWKHFDCVAFLEPYDPTAPSPRDTMTLPVKHNEAGQEERGRTTWGAAHDSSCMPSWLTVLAVKVDNFNNFAIVLVTQDPSSGDGDGDGADAGAGGEAIIMAPHGIYASEKRIQALIRPSSTPTVSSAQEGEARDDSQSTQQHPVVPRVLAYLGPYKDAYSLGLQAVSGIGETLCFAQLPDDGIKYFVHSGDLLDGDLSYTGLLSYVLRDEPRTLEWGVEQLRQGKGGDGIVYSEREDNGDALKLPREVIVENGESFVLV